MGKKLKSVFDSWKIFILLIVICFAFGVTKALVRYQNIALVVLFIVMAIYAYLLEGKNIGSDMDEESDMVSED